LIKGIDEARKKGEKDERKWKIYEREKEEEGKKGRSNQISEKLSVVRKPEVCLNSSQ
jgi:hypothetical protein